VDALLEAFEVDILAFSCNTRFVFRFPFFYLSSFILTTAHTQPSDFEKMNYLIKGWQ
jgi:hypothetical protein